MRTCFKQLATGCMRSLRLVESKISNVENMETWIYFSLKSWIFFCLKSWKYKHFPPREAGFTSDQCVQVRGRLERWIFSWFHNKIKISNFNLLLKGWRAKETRSWCVSNTSTSSSTRTAFERQPSATLQSFENMLIWSYIPSCVTNFCLNSVSMCKVSPVQSSVQPYQN